MPYAVTLRLDPAAAAPIEGMWRALAATGLHGESLALGYPPHVTLTIHPDGVDAVRLAESLRRCAARLEAIALRIAGFGVFAEPEAVLYLAPVVTPALLRCHENIANALSGLPCDPHYHVDAWVPHITLAKGGAAGQAGWMGRALDGLAPLWPGLLHGCADRLELVHFRPVTVLQSLALPTAFAAPATSV